MNLSFIHSTMSTHSTPKAVPGRARRVYAPTPATTLRSRSAPGAPSLDHPPSSHIGSPSHLSGFPGSRSLRRHLLAEWISSSFTRMSLCRARHQS